MRLAQPASGSNTLARVSRVSPTIPSCPLARESVSFDEAIRELLFGTGNRGTYRILFTVIGKSVYILHVRHGSMLPLNPEEE